MKHFSGKNILCSSIICILLFLSAETLLADSLILSNKSGPVATIHDPGGNLQTVVGPYTVEFGNTSYTAFCVDYATVNWGLNDNYKMIAVPNLSAYSAAAWIYANYENYGYRGEIAQLAIWEVVFETLSGGSVSSVLNGNGQFYVSNKGTGLTDDDLQYANSLATAAINSGSSFNTRDYRLLVSPETNFYGSVKQDFLVRVPSVPEPSMLLLFGIGLTGLCLAKRY